MNMRTGDIAALLNIREPKPLARAEIGRGFLVVDYLKSGEIAAKTNYLQELKTNGDRYNGFTLITIDRDERQHYSLSSFSNRSNCLKLNQSAPSFITTNSMRTDRPWYRGIVFKRKFDALLHRTANLIDDRVRANDLNSSDSSNSNNGLNNDPTNEQTNVQINDRTDNLKDCTATERTVQRRRPPTSSADVHAAKPCSNCPNSKACNGRRTTTERAESTDDTNSRRTDDADDNVDFTRSENQAKLAADLLDVMLSPENYYDEECKGDYFQTQNCLTDELSKRAIASLCISLREYNYGSR